MAVRPIGCDLCGQPTIAQPCLDCELVVELTRQLAADPDPDPDDDTTEEYEGADAR